MHVGLVFAGIAIIISFILQTVTVTKMYENDRNDYRMAWLGVAMVTTGIGFVIISGIFIYYMSSIYPIMIGR